MEVDEVMKYKLIISIMCTSCYVCSILMCIIMCTVTYSENIIKESVQMFVQIPFHGHFECTALFIL